MRSGKSKFVIGEIFGKNRDIESVIKSNFHTSSYFLSAGVQL